MKEIMYKKQSYEEWYNVQFDKLSVEYNNNNCNTITQNDKVESLADGIVVGLLWTVVAVYGGFLVHRTNVKDNIKEYEIFYNENINIFPKDLKLSKLFNIGNIDLNEFKEITNHIYSKSYKKYEE